MLRLLLFAGVLYGLPVSLFAQCWNQGNKIIPDRHLSQSNGFGKSVTLAGDFMAVGDYLHDTLAYNGGVVFLYQRQAATWTLVATMLPSDPTEEARFGEVITLTDNYLFVGSRSKSHVYVYAKEAQWTGGTEDNIILAPEESNYFGRAIEARSDEEKLLISDTQTRDGIVYVYSKPTAGWAADAPVFLKLEPTDDHLDRVQEFGHAIAFSNDLMAIGAPNSDGGLGSVYVHQDQSNGAWSDWQPQAQLHSSFAPGYSSGFGRRVQIMHENIFVQSSYSGSNVVFQFKPRTVWQDTSADTAYYMSDASRREYTKLMASYDSSLVILGTGPDGQSNAYSFRLTSPNRLSQQPTQTLYARSVSPYLPSSLTVDADGTLAIGHTKEPYDRQQGGAVWIVPHAEKKWNYEQREEVFYDYYNASEDYFGTTLHQTEDYLFVGAIRDRRDPVATGSVHVYRKRITGWQKVHELATDTTVVDFGRALQFQRDTLYVGAGATLVQRFKKGSTDQDWIPLSTISPPDSLKIGSFGSHLLVRGSIMAVMGHMNTRQWMENAVFIFEKSGSSWQYQTVIPIGRNNFFGHPFTRALDIYDQTILVAGKQGHIIEKDSTGSWQIAATLTASDSRDQVIHMAQSAVLHEDKAIIGFPNFSDAPNYNTGAVYVFKRTGQAWQDTDEHRKLIPQTPTPTLHFGTSMALQGNTLVVGAPKFRAWYNYFDQEQEPGSVFVFQALDTNWDHIVEVAEIQGDQNTPGDQYGTTLIFEGNELIVGAPTDDHLHGRWSGAVYTGSFPELPARQSDSLHKIMCIDDPVYQLTASELGGEWTGSGIVDTQAGTFSPRLAGPGQHILRYQGSTCSSSAYRLIEVVASFEATLVNEAELYLCDSSEFVTLAANQADQGRYEWFYLAEGNQQPVAVGQDSSQFETNLPGKYWVLVSIGACQQTSDTLSVHLCASPDITLPDQSSACPPFPEVRINNFQSSYQYHLVEIDQQGKTTLLDTIKNLSVAIEQAGTYQLHTYAYACQWVSDTFTIRDPIADMVIQPTGTHLTVCTSEQWLEVPLLEGYQYTWYYYAKEGPPSEIGKSHGVFAAKTGYYQVVVHDAECEWTSEPTYIEFLKPIEMGKVANVFTPNGDGINDTFGIPMADITHSNLSVYNRYGKLLYQTNEPTGRWNGSNAPPGVYFWSLRYQHPCDKVVKTKKGQVSLIRAQTH